MVLSIDFYRPQTKLQEGNVFTSVCQSYCTWGRGYCMMSLPFWLPGSMFLLRDGGLLLWSHVHSRGVSVSGPMFLLGVSLQGVLLTETPWRETTPGQRPLPGQKTPLLNRDLPPGQRPPSWTETPFTETPLDRDHPSWTETPLLDRNPPPGQKPPSWTETPCVVKSGRYASY